MCIRYRLAQRFTNLLRRYTQLAVLIPYSLCTLLRYVHKVPRLGGKAIARSIHQNLLIVDILNHILGWVVAAARYDLADSSSIAELSIDDCVLNL